MTPHRFLPNDPANKYLTDGDRTALRNATGVDVRADGGIACPVSMDVVTYGRVLEGVGQIASDRANGCLNGTITTPSRERVRLPAAGVELLVCPRAGSGVEGNLDEFLVPPGLN